MDTAPQNAQDEHANPPSEVVELPHVAGDVEQNRDIAAISYLLVLSVVVYFLKKDSPFVRYHSKQAMVLFALFVVSWFIPILGKVLELIVLAGCIYGFFEAAQGHWSDVPFAGPLSRGDRKSARQSLRKTIDLCIAVWKGLTERTKEEKKNDVPSETH